MKYYCTRISLYLSRLRKIIKEANYEYSQEFYTLLGNRYNAKLPRLDICDYYSIKYYYHLNYLKDTELRDVLNSIYKSIKPKTLLKYTGEDILSGSIINSLTKSGDLELLEYYK